MEIPSRYFQFLRSGQPALMTGVLDHNRHDLISLAVMATHALRLAHGGPDMCRDGFEQLALGRIYERADLADRARLSYDYASRALEPDVQAHALARLAVMFRRDGRFDDAAHAWRRVLDAADRSADRRSMAPLRRLAAEALAIHHEHRAKDPTQARVYAALLADRQQRVQTTSAAERVAHRLGRLDRKIRAATNTTGGPVAAPLLPRD